jgi:hypothetical protein
MDPIHQHEDGKWYFCDETWADELGPYESREEADKMLTEYCRYLDEGPRINIRWED